MKFLCSVFRKRCVSSIYKFYTISLTNNSFRSLSYLGYSHFQLITSVKSVLENDVSHIYWNVKKAFSISTIVKKKNSKTQNRKEFPESNTLTNDEDLEDEKFNAMMSTSGGSLRGISSIAVIQPWIKWGPRKRVETNPKLLLQEACALIRSLPFTHISFQEYAPLLSTSKTTVFGSGTLERLVTEVRASNSQAVFISLDHITRVQKCELEEQFGLPVFDRYFIVLAIFKHHASTVEARLQIALAELPFMSKRWLTENDKFILDQRETNLKNALQRLENRRENTRKNRQKNSLPSVAVVGYTNCGKTSFIRALTGDERLQGEDRLFATLDVTAHKGYLPCGLGIVFLDSVGFIQDIPTTLIASFNATLQDAIHSDVVVFVRDISHPDSVGQTKTVYETLRSLPLAESTPIIIVNNKADLIQAENLKALEDTEGILASSVTGQGLKTVVESIQKEVLRVTGRRMYRMKLETGSPKIEWLCRVVGVTSSEVDQTDPQFTHLYVVMNEAEKAAFRKAFQ